MSHGDSGGYCSCDGAHAVCGRHEMRYVGRDVDKAVYVDAVLVVKFPTMLLS